MKISETVRDILAECTIEGNILILPDMQLERKIYTDVNKVLEQTGAEAEFLPQGTFKASGTMINVCVVKIRKAI